MPKKYILIEFFKKLNLYPKEQFKVMSKNF